jgi:hypothetical protein
MVGDARNMPARSLYVRLKGPETGKRRRRQMDGRRDWRAWRSPRHHPRKPRPCQLQGRRRRSPQLSQPAAAEAPAAAKAHLGATSPYADDSFVPPVAMSQPLPGTLAQAYLRARAITVLRDIASLRFHPRCYYRPDDDAPPETWPAMIAAVTDLNGMITGAGSVANFAADGVPV